MAKPTRSSTETLITGLREILRQALALAKRSHQPGGTVVCEVNLPIKLRFNAATADERDAIVMAVQQAFDGIPGVETTIGPDEANQRWNLITRGKIHGYID